MQAQLTLIADAANISQEGKLNILGEFDALWTPSVPTVWPSLVYVAKVEVEANDGVDLQFELRVVSEDGDLIFRAGIAGRLERVGDPDGERPRVPILVPIANAGFPNYGTYSFELWGNGTQLGAIPLYVRPRPSSPG